MEWSNLKIGAKDVLAALIFAFSASGVYYKIYYENQQKEAIDNIKADVQEKRMHSLEERVNTLETQVKQLNDDNLRRQALENEGYRVYAPMKKTR